MSVTTCVARILAVLLAPGVAQSQAPVVSLPERIALARPLLMHAEAAAPVDPGARAFLLYRAAGAWLDLDRVHAVELYREAFVSARLIDSIPLRKDIERDILSELLPISPAAALDLIPRTESETQEVLNRAAINFELANGDLRGVIKVFDQASAGGSFSEVTAIKVLSAVAESDTEERVGVFSAALAAYKAQTVEQSKPWTASKLVAGYWQRLSTAPVLSAIDIVLERAAEMENPKALGSGSIGYGNNSLSYKTYTDLELFAVAPALKKLDPERAAALLEAHPAVEEYLRRFPDGLHSFNPDGFLPLRAGVGIGSTGHPPKEVASFATEDGAHSSPLTSADMGLEFTIPLNLEQGLGVGGATLSYAPSGSPEAALLGKGNACPPDVPHILASVDTVPLTRQVPSRCSGPIGSNRCSYRDEFPRDDLLNTVAERCTYSKKKAVALSVLNAELQMLPQLIPEQRTKYLASAVDLYLRLGDRNAAASTVTTGFEVAAALFADDSQSSELKRLAKAVWPSAEVYRKMISLGVNANFDETRTAVEAIPDPDLRELERVMLARTLLGIPVRRYIVFFDGGSSMMQHSEVAYDDY